jgi:hypothetical protein
VKNSEGLVASGQVGRFEEIEFARKLGIGGGFLAIWDSGFGWFVIP